MKLRYIEIRNFKGIEEFSHSFVDELTQEIFPITALFGDNGSGKTSVLQAIALIISMATWKTESPEDLKWHGFIAERMGSKGETYIRADLQLDDAEIAATQTLFDQWKSLKFKQPEDSTLVRPGKQKVIRIEYKGGKVSAVGGAAGAFQLLGRYYIKQILKFDKKHREMFNAVGDVFWFDQYRNLGSGVISHELDEEVIKQESLVSWQAGVEGLREYLKNWFMFHMFGSKPSENDFIVRLEQKVAAVFPGTSFHGIEPRQHVSATPTAKDFFFMIQRDGSRYDIAEMSSGEQAVFSIMYQFVYQEISNSIVLIDELELHLHPPEQQMLYNALPKISQDSQYIVTSHSPYLFNSIPKVCAVRLEGGRKVT